MTDEADLWRVNYLIYRPMDLRTMETKASKNKYCSLQEFQADAETIVHNVVIYHGGRPCASFVVTSPQSRKKNKGLFSF